jgi:probable phosphoglycerate mutase
MKIILVRHGQTEWNKKEIFRGRTDIPLSSIGTKQAQLVAKNLRDFHAEIIYASPLKRALGTAEIIGSKLHIPVVPEPNLIEVDCGEWQGLSLDLVRGKHPKSYKRWVTNPGEFVFPSGEGLPETRTRVAFFINKILSRPVESTVIVSHRVINKLIILLLLSLDSSYFWKFRQDLASISVFDYENRTPVLCRLNDICHLKKSIQTEGKDF